MVFTLKAFHLTAEGSFRSSFGERNVPSELEPILSGTPTAFHPRPSLQSLWPVGAERVLPSLFFLQADQWSVGEWRMYRRCRMVPVIQFELGLSGF